MSTTSTKLRDSVESAEGYRRSFSPAEPELRGTSPVLPEPDIGYGRELHREGAVVFSPGDVLKWRVSGTAV